MRTNYSIYWSWRDEVRLITLGTFAGRAPTLDDERPSLPQMLSHGLRLARSTFARSAPLLPSSPGGARRTLCSGAAALPWEPARFKGANIVIEKPVDDAFEPRLVLALDELREAGRRGVWMRVPIEHSAAAAVAARHGFAFHHAEGSTAAQAC